MIIRTPPKLSNRNSIIQYLEVHLWGWLRDLSTGILKINFTDNFQSFIVQDLLIPANTEISIHNEFSIYYPGSIPSGRIITRQIGDANILDGDTRWTTTHVSLRNPSSNDATITILFFK
jgi:hypothetical protein